MNPFEFILGIVIVVMVAGIIMNRQKHSAAAQGRVSDSESARMKEEIQALRERVQVLERIATDKESQLEREIERLRDR